MCLCFYVLVLLCSYVIMLLCSYALMFLCSYAYVLTLFFEFLCFYVCICSLETKTHKTQGTRHKTHKTHKKQKTHKKHKTHEKNKTHKIHKIHKYAKAHSCLHFFGTPLAQHRTLFIASYKWGRRRRNKTTRADTPQPRALPPTKPRELFTQHRAPYTAACTFLFIEYPSSKATSWYRS